MPHLKSPSTQTPHLPTARISTLKWVWLFSRAIVSKLAQHRPLNLSEVYNDRHFLRNLLIRVAIACSTLAIAVSAYYGYRAIRFWVLENLKENALLEVQQGVDEIDGWLETAIARIETLANSPDIRSLNWQTIEPYLQLEIDRSPDFFKFFLAYPDGSRYNTAGATPDEGNIRDRSHFQQGIMGNNFISNPVISRSTGVRQINIVTPIWSVPPLHSSRSTPTRQSIRDRSLEAFGLPQGNTESSPVGVLGGSVSSNRVIEVVSRLKYGDDSYAFALNSLGKAIVHRDRSLMSAKERPAASFLDSTNPSLASVAARMVDGERGIELIELDDRWQYVAYVPLANANWSVALVIPRENINNELRPLDSISLATISLAVVLLAVLWQVHAFEKKQLQKSEDLLLNILPAPIADKLKHDRSTIADSIAEATILFADIVGFTPLSAQMPPRELVTLLDRIFSTFDELAERYGLEKIKTIGDAYMVVGGLPLPRSDHAEAIAEMALDMQECIAQFYTGTGQAFQLRIGINTGAVVAGVIGTKKFIYDLWGDAVNMASRMESSALPGKIQVTAATYEKLKHKYSFESRGEIMVKGKGKTLAYWLVSRHR